MNTETVTFNTTAGTSTFELTYCDKTRPADMVWKITTLVLHNRKQPAGCGLIMFSDNKEELLMYAEQSSQPRNATPVNIKFNL